MPVSFPLDKIPALPGSLETLEQGITSSLHPQNLDNKIYLISSKKIENSTKYSLLFDPQTSGGLLASVSFENAEDCLQELIRAGYTDSRIIGKVVEKNNNISCLLQ